MLAQRRWTTAAVAVLLLAGGVTAMAAQDAEAPRLDAEALAEQMELDEDGRADLEKLGDLLERRQAMREGMAGLHAEMRETMQGLASTLTADQFRELHREMRSVMRMGPPGDGERGAMMRGGMMRGGMMRGHAPGHGARSMQGHPHRGTAARAPGAGGGRFAGECPWVQPGNDVEEDGGEETP